MREYNYQKIKIIPSYYMHKYLIINKFDYRKITYLHNEEKKYFYMNTKIGERIC